MHNLAILYPVFALAFWTCMVLLLIPITRFRAGLRREIVPNDFKYGESSSVPAYVRIPNRNYMNLLELPILFYTVCLLIFVTGSTSPLTVYIAWLYVALRVIHSAIHLSYNHVIHRLIAFATSNFTLVSLWIFSALKIFSNAAV